MTSKAKEILEKAKKDLDNTIFPEGTPEYLKKIIFNLNKSELNDLLDSLERLEELEKAQDLDIKNLKIFVAENKYQVAIRVLKEAFIVLGKSDIANTCWFKYLEELEKENQELKFQLECKSKGNEIIIKQMDLFMKQRDKCMEENDKLKKTIEVRKQVLNCMKGNE